MKKHIYFVFLLAIISLLSINCATLLNGYEDTVLLNNAPIVFAYFYRTVWKNR